MARPLKPLGSRKVLFAVLGICLNARAQTAPASPSDAALAQPPLTVTARSAPVFEPVSSDLGIAPPARAPQSITVLGSDLLKAAGASSLSQALKLDASLGDFYNTTGYIESLQVRGFTLDTRDNFLRNGLPVSNYTPFAPENKQQVEVLKGVTGLQAGVSAPGGLVDYVTKKPTDEPLRTLELGVSGRGGAYTHLDLGGRAGADQAFGYRINLAGQQLRPEVRSADGSRQFASAAFDWRAAPGTRVEAELEWSRQSQPSVPGFGLLDTTGNGVARTLPAPIDPRINLNNQPWSLPFVNRAFTGSLSLTQALGDDWQLQLRTQQQRIHTDDRIAFPDGCSSGPAYVYPGFCGTPGHVGDFDLYDYRSENERRNLGAWNLQLTGHALTGAVAHQLRFGVLSTRYTEALPPYQAYNFVGTGNIATTPAFAPAPAMTSPNTQRQESSRELYVSDAMTLDPRWTLYAGLRHTRLTRASQITDDPNTTRYDQQFTTPWAGVAYTAAPGVVAYASWGEGVETEVVPNRPTDFDNPGVALPALKSRQTEVGVKWLAHPRLLLSSALFDIHRPSADNLPGANGLLHRVAGARQAEHRGVEFTAAGRATPQLDMRASAMWLAARITQSPDPTLLGQRPTDVPRFAASLFADYKVAALAGLSVNSLLTYTGSKAVTADNAVNLPAAWSMNAGASYATRIGNTPLTWRVQIDNLLDRRYWADAPTQSWGGIYLFPAPARTLSVSVQFDL